MDGVSGASAVVAIAQVGFSLAQTLNTYVADVRNGRGDIANLANEIDATATHIEALNKLIQENHSTNGWNANGLKIAKKCSTDFEEILCQLRAVFSRSGAALSPNLVTRDDIDISILNRLTWPTQKTRLSGLKQDLYRVKIDILLFLNIYKAHVGTPQSEKDAAAERVAALWRSKLAAQRQLVSVKDPPVTRTIMDPPNSFKSQNPTQRRARFVDTSPSKSRSRSRSRQRSRRDREPSRRRRYSSSSDGESPSGIQRTRQAQRQAHSPSHKQSTQEVQPDASNPGHDKVQGSPGKASFISNSNHDKKIENSNIVGSRMLAGAEVEYPQTESLIALFLKSMMGSGKTVSNKFSSRELLNQALSHPKEAGKLLNVVSKMQSQPLNTEDAPEVVLHDPTVQGGIATTRAISLVNTNATGFQPFEIDYPIPLLAKRLHCEQKMHHKGSPFGLQAWINFHEIPPWCQQYIREFLEHGSNENHFWSLLIVDPIYKKSKSWTGRFRGKMGTKPDDLISVLIVFKHCKKLKETPSQGAKDELIDALAARLTEPLSDLVGDVWERSKRRRNENRFSRPRSPIRRRSRSRSRQYDPNIVSYGSASVANHNRPFPSSSARNIQTPAPHDLGYTDQNPNGDQSVDVTQPGGTYQGVNAYTPSNIYQPPTSYQDANPYQSTHPTNQKYTYQPSSPYQSAIPSYGEPTAQAYGVTERQDLVSVDIDDDGIDANIPDDQLTREVMARYTGAWQMDENGVAHEENYGSRGEAHGAQPPSIIEVVDDDLDMV